MNAKYMFIMSCITKPKTEIYLTLKRDKTFQASLVAPEKGITFKFLTLSNFESKVGSRILNKIFNSYDKDGEFINTEDEAVKLEKQLIEFIVPKIIEISNNNHNLDLSCFDTDYCFFLASTLVNESMFKEDDSLFLD